MAVNTRSGRRRNRGDAMVIIAGGVVARVQLTALQGGRHVAKVSRVPSPSHVEARDAHVEAAPWSRERRRRPLPRRFGKYTLIRKLATGGDGRTLPRDAGALGRRWRGSSFSSAYFQQ